MREPRPPMRVPSSTMHAEPNVTPFLDVLLVLLILFMFLTLNQQKVLTTQLPVPPSPTPAVSVPIVLEVKPNATYTINAEVVPSSARLASRLRELYADRPTKAIIVRGASGVRYQEVVTAVDIARGAGVSVIGLDKRR